MKKCKLCDGSGVIWVAQPDIGGYMIEPCPNCNAGEQPAWDDPNYVPQKPEDASPEPKTSLEDELAQFKANKAKWKAQNRKESTR